jgi:signal transduction histidine kinase
MTQQAPNPRFASQQFARIHRRRMRAAALALALGAAALALGTTVVAAVTGGGVVVVAVLALAGGGVLAALGVLQARRLAAAAERHLEDSRRALGERVEAAEAEGRARQAEAERRAEALEARAAELREALEKLRAAQAELVKTEKLASMGRLVGGVLHEVNNPLNAVTNTLPPLEETVAGLAAAADPAVAVAAGEAREMLRVIQRGAARTRTIVEALKSYARGDPETMSEVNVLRSLDEALEALRPKLGAGAGPGGIQVVKDIQPGIRVTGFGGQIGQLVSALLTNAVQALAPRGHGTIQVRMQRRGEEAILTIADDGPGIPADKLPHIFDPFFTTRDVGQGAGLGLSVAHGIAERHGGRIEIECPPGGGTTVRVVLPIYAGFLAVVPPPPEI